MKKDQRQGTGGHILRIIGGSARGIRIAAPPTDRTRPTQDRIKESVFNILQPYFEGAQVLDLFSGSGSLGLEALSRGAENAVFADESGLCAGIIKDNALKTGFADKTRVLTLSVDRALTLLASEGKKFDLIFMDPPYCCNFVSKTLQMLAKFDIMKEEAIIAVEHHQKEAAPEGLEQISRARVKEYGDTVFSFYIREPQA